MMMMSSGLTRHQPTHEGHLRQDDVLTWFCNEATVTISHICIKCKTRTNSRPGDLVWNANYLATQLLHLQLISALPVPHMS